MSWSAGSGLFGIKFYAGRFFCLFGRNLVAAQASAVLAQVLIPHFRPRMVVRLRRRYGRRRSFRFRGRQVGRMRGPVGNWRNFCAFSTSLELKFKDIQGSLINILGIFVIWQVFLFSVNLVDQGYGQQDFQGRKIIAKFLQLKMQLDRDYYANAINF